MPPTAAFVSVPMPDIQFVGAHPANFGVGRGGIIPEALVVHIMGGRTGSEAATRSWFWTPPGDGPGTRGRDAAGNRIGASSAHYGVTRGGEIVCYVQPADTAYSNGILNRGWEDRPAAPLVNANGPDTINRWCLSIEHEGKPDSDPIVTPEQFTASTRLAAWLFASHMLPFADRTGVEVSRSRILRHTDFDPVDRADCPGWPSPRMEEYIATVKGLLFPARPDTDPRAALTEALVGLEMTAGSVLRVAGELDAVAGAPADVRRLANELRAIANGATAVVARHRH